MLIKIIGWLWLISGIVFLVNPEGLRRYLRWKSLWKLKWFLIGIAWVVGVMLIKLAYNFSGPAFWVIIILGLMAVVKGFIFISSKASEGVINWFIARPIGFLRGWAAVQIMLGAYFVYFI